jgi:hypothetical protein
VKGITQMLNKFASISLEEMDDVKLLDRTDTKFVFSLGHLPILFEKSLSAYRILEINGQRLSRYETLYFDTENFDLYNKHQNKKLNRYKIRIRKYVDSELSFFEIKFKNNKGRTIKQRIKIKNESILLEGNAAAFLKDKTNIDPLSLQPKLWVDYSRITLVNITTQERVTIDVDLRFRSKHPDTLLNHIAIVEVKQNKSIASHFGKLLKELHIHEGSISKYCIGVTQVYDHVKKNNFKPNLTFLNKIAHVTKY